MSLPETEGALRGWLKTNTNINAAISGRAFFAVPQQDSPDMPFTVSYRVGGSPDDHLQDYPDFIIECWAKNKHDASELARVVCNEIITLRIPVVIDGVKILSGSVNFGPVPNGGTTWAKRYRIDTTFHMRSA